jgi:hypothetical protein
MNQESIKHIIRWSARLVTLLGYFITCGMLFGGLAIMGLSMLLLLFTSHCAPVASLLCGAAFASFGAITLIRQLRCQAIEMRQMLKVI